MESHRERLKREVLSGLDLSAEIADEEVRRMIDRCILNDSGAQYMPLREKLQLKTELYNAIRKLDILSDLLEDDSISEIMINGPDTIFVERNGVIERSGKSFESTEKLMTVLQQIVSSANRLLNDTNPIADVILPDRSSGNFLLSCV